jgi:hypothetical protein
MDDMDPDLQVFLKYWFSGWMQGMDALDESSRKKVLHACGKACAQSYTAQKFREAWQSGLEMESFLQNLSTSFPEASYTWDGANNIQVRYNHCGCDLVKLGLVKGSSFCECSVANLRENFQQVLGVPVSVKLETSILGGGTHCAFTVQLQN